MAKEEKNVKDASVGEIGNGKLLGVVDGILKQIETDKSGGLLTFDNGVSKSDINVEGGVTGFNPIGEVKEGDKRAVSGEVVNDFYIKNEKAIQLGFKDINRGVDAQNTIYHNIKYIKVFRENSNDLFISSLEDTESDNRTLRIRDADTNESVLLIKGLQDGLNKYSFEKGGGYIEVEIDFSGASFNDWNYDKELTLDKVFFNEIKYPKFFNSNNKSFPNLSSMLFDLSNSLSNIKILNADLEYYYSLNLVKSSSMLAFYVTKKKKDKTSSVIDCGTWTINNPTGEQSVSKFIGITSSPQPEKCYFEIDFSKIENDTRYGSAQGFNSFNFFVDEKYILSSGYVNKTVPYKTTSNFKPFEMGDFDGRWFCNPNEEGYSLDNEFILASGDNENLLSKLYEPLRAKHSRYITRSNNPLYSIMGQNGIMQNAYLYYFTPEHYSKTIFINTGTHSRESEGWLGVAKMLDLIYNHYEGNDALTFLRFNVRFIVMPMLNIWGTSKFPRTNDLNENGVNLNRNFPNKFVSGPSFGNNALDQVESRELWKEIIKNINEIDFIADCHTTVNTGYGDYSLDFGDPIKFDQLILAQKQCAGYLITKNIVEKDTRRPGLANRTLNVPWQPYFGINAYGIPQTLAQCCRDVLNVQSSTFEHSDFVWWLGQPYSQGLGTSIALKRSVEWYTNLIYNIAKNL